MYKVTTPDTLKQEPNPTNMKAAYNFLDQVFRAGHAFFWRKHLASPWFVSCLLTLVRVSTNQFSYYQHPSKLLPQIFYEIKILYTFIVKS